MVRSYDWIEYPENIPFGSGERLAYLADKTLIVLYWDDELGEWLGAPSPVTHWVDVFGPYE